MSEKKKPAKKKPAPKKKQKPKVEQPADAAPVVALVESRPIEDHPALSGKAPSGWAKMQLAGRKAVMLSLTSEQYEKFRAAASNDQRKLTQWIVVQCSRGLQTV